MSLSMIVVKDKLNERGLFSGAAGVVIIWDLMAS